MRHFTIGLLVLLSGCATLEDKADQTRDFLGRHPVVAVSTGVAIGALATGLALRHHHERTVSVNSPGTATIQPITCSLCQQ